MRNELEQINHRVEMAHVVRGVDEPIKQSFLKKYQKQISLIGILLIVIILGAAGFGWRRMRDNNNYLLEEPAKVNSDLRRESYENVQKIVEGNEPSEQVIEWAVYENEEYGFKLDYPKIWEVNEYKEFADSSVLYSISFDYQPTPETWPVGFTVVVYDPQGKTLEEWAEENFVFVRLNGTRVSEIEGPTALGGQDAIEGKHFSYDEHITQIATKHSDMIYKISYEWGVEGERINGNDMNYYINGPIYKKMRDSFEFMN